MAYNDFTFQIDNILHRICAGLQISDTQRTKAKDRYDGVARLLGSDDSPFLRRDLSIYSQGSLKIGTTVKPIGKSEYDLDLVCQIAMGKEEMDPVRLLDLMYIRLREDGRYTHLVEKMNRCVRLNYADEFHMDILPALPDRALNAPEGCVHVPDREAQDWSPSNPSGYAEWFEDQAKRVTVQAFEDYQKGMGVRADVNVEELPEEEAFLTKPALKRAVQLMKRSRDIMFEKSPKLAPISVVITTLAGEFYEGTASVKDTLIHILGRIIHACDEAAPHRIVVRNPTNLKEDFSEKWDEHPERYHAFTRWTKTLYAGLIEAQEVEGKGMDEAAEILSRLFGNTRVEKAFRDQALAMRKQRETGNLGIAAGGLTIMSSSDNAAPVRDHTFHCE